MPPPVLVDLRRDWGVELGQRLRESHWVPAQVYLTGAMDCRTPDPLNVMDLCGRYQVNDRAVRLARHSLSQRQQDDITAYLQRGELYVSRTSTDGHFSVPIPPAMSQDEADAFRALWRAMWDAGAMRRIERKRIPTPPEHPEDL